MEINELESYIFLKIEKNNYINNAFNNLIIELIRIVLNGLNDLDSFDEYLNQAKIIDDRLNEIKIRAGEQGVSYIPETVKYYKKYFNL